MGVGYQFGASEQDAEVQEAPCTSHAHTLSNYEDQSTIEERESDDQQSTSETGDEAAISKVQLPKVGTVVSYIPEGLREWREATINRESRKGLRKVQTLAQHPRARARSQSYRLGKWGEQMETKKARPKS